MRRIRLPGVCAIAAVWPLVAASESAAPIAPPVEQATADCTAPTYASDRLVCADPGLRALDAELARLWARAEAAGRVAASAQLAQADWFRQRSLCAFRDDHRGCVEGAYRLAHAAVREEPVAPVRWAAAVRQSRRHPDPPHERFWLVGTDGDPPDGLPQEVREGFQIARECLAEATCAATLRRPPTGNSLLIALTWCFIRCPAAVQDNILDTLDAGARGERHALSVPRSSRKVLHQGAGRAVSGAPRLRRLFRYLDDAPINTDTLNALAMTLSRREEAPEALTREQVERFLLRLGGELIARIEARDFQIRFRNTLSAIAGLFRWRKCDPFALLAARDIPQREQKIDLVTRIIEFLDGAGDPDILRRIEDQFAPEPDREGAE